MIFPAPNRICSFLCLFFTTAAGLLILPLRADVLELTNGDHYRGTVLSMSQTTVDFQSEVQGRLRLPRAKVASITFHDLAAPKPSSDAATPPPAGTAPSAAPATNAPSNNQADAVIQQMRQQGIDPKLINQVQEQIFGKASPEAAQKFNGMVDGLMSGKMSVRDLRSEAQSSINQIKAAKAELGDDAGDMLDGYLAILEKFVQETGSGSANTPAPQPAPAKPAATAPAPNK